MHLYVHSWIVFHTNMREDIPGLVVYSLGECLECTKIKLCKQNRPPKHPNSKTYSDWDLFTWLKTRKGHSQDTVNWKIVGTQKLRPTADVGKGKIIAAEWVLDVIKMDFIWSQLVLIKKSCTYNFFSKKLSSSLSTKSFLTTFILLHTNRNITFNRTYTQ